MNKYINKIIVGFVIIFHIMVYSLLISLLIQIKDKDENIIRETQIIEKEIKTPENNVLDRYIVEHLFRNERK